MFDYPVAVYELISKSNDALPLADLLRRPGVVLMQLAKRLAYDHEVSLNSITKLAVHKKLLARFASCVLRNPVDSFKNIGEKFRGFRLHKA